MKKVSKKLEFTTTTIQHLVADDLRTVQGGASETCGDVGGQTAATTRNPMCSRRESTCVLSNDPSLRCGQTETQGR